MKDLAYPHGSQHAVAAQIAALRKEWRRALASATAAISRRRYPPPVWRAGTSEVIVPRF